MMPKNTESYFSKKYYPMFLMISGLFILFFPLDWIIDDFDFLFYVHLGIGLAIFLSGIITYLQKKKEYPEKFRTKIKKILIIVGVSVAIFFLAAVILGVILGVSSALNALAPTTSTSRIDVELLEKRVLDWVNQQRAKNKISGVNLDNILMQLVQIRTTDIANAEPDEREAIGNQNATEIAKKKGLDCIGEDGNVIPIMEYTMIMPHGEFREIEQLVDFGMKQLINNDEAREMIFASNVTRTGISGIVTEEHLLVTQNFC